MNRNIKIEQNAYRIEDLDRPSTAPSFKPTMVIKYMAPRSVGLNLSNSFQGSLRSFALPNVDSKLVTSGIRANYGLAAMIDNSTSSNTVPLHKIDGEYINGESRTFSKLDETLIDNIALCFQCAARNRANEIQIGLLQTNANKNSTIIERMFQSEIETANQLIGNASRYKSDLKKKLDDVHRATIANDEHYQKLLSKRNAINRDLFEYQRRSTQNRAESDFLRCRTQQFNEEINFYTLKNNVLQRRRSKLRYELDEEIFASQVLQMEVKVLQNEKITNDDVYLSSMHDIHQSFNSKQLATTDGSNAFRKQLGQELRRMQSDYERKLESYREELHRKLELEYHRYRMHQLAPLPVTKENEQSIEQFQREKKETDKQIRTVREHCFRINCEIQSFEKQILDKRSNAKSSPKSQRHLAMLQQIIRERQKQLNDVLNVQTNLKKALNNYQIEVQQHTNNSISKSNEIQQSNINITTEEKRKSNHQLSSSFIQLDAPLPLTKPNSIEKTTIEERTLVRSNDFDAEPDCRELQKKLNKLNFDEIGVIRILCQRNVVQRLQIREKYKALYGQNLSDIFENEIKDNAKTILKVLLLSPVQYDCYELRRILHEKNFEENFFVEIFLTRSNQHIKKIIENYSKIFKSSLVKDIIGDEETTSKRIIVALLQANRPEQDHIDHKEVLSEAQDLYETNSKWRKDGSTFIKLLSNRSNQSIKQIFAAYEQFSRLDIEDAIQVDRDQSLCRTLMAIVRIIRNRPRFFAFALRKAFKISDGNQENLSRIIVSRCEIDIAHIKFEFEKISRRTLYDHIQTDTSGNFKRAILELLRQRLYTNNGDPSFKNILESSLVTRKPRLHVQWKDPISQKGIGRSISSRDLSSTTLFDQNNQGKMNTFLGLNTKPSILHFQEGRPRNGRSYSSVDDNK